MIKEINSKLLFNGYLEEIDMGYMKNYLTSVILKIDFLEPIKEFQRLIVNVSPIIKKKYEIMDVKKTETYNFEIKDNNVDKKSISSQNVLNYYDIDRKKQFTISKDSMYILYKEYSDFSEFSSIFIEVLSIINNLDSNILIKRIGLRYIDEIDYSFLESTVFDINSIISPDFIQPFESIEGFRPIKGMSVLELVKGDTKIKLQYGINNPDYPSQIRKKIFVIDTDVSRKDIICIQDINETIKELHEIAKLTFETIILEDLRKEMDRNE